MKNLKINK